MKKFVSIVSLFALVLALTTSAFAAEADGGIVSVMSGFADVTEDHPYATAIAVARDRGIVQGCPDGTFHPDNIATRGELAAMLRRALTTPDTPLPLRTDLDGYQFAVDLSWLYLTAVPNPETCTATHTIDEVTEILEGGNPNMSATQEFLEVVFKGIQTSRGLMRMHRFFGEEVYDPAMPLSRAQAARAAVLIEAYLEG